MADPTLKSTSVQIKYSSSDGYRSEVGFGSNRAPTPQAALIGSIEELARVLALFGFEAEAKSAVDGAFRRVAAWRAASKAAKEAHGIAPAGGIGGE
jgi:hypothetical protein